MKTATLAISASVEGRRVWVLLASNSWNCSQVIPDAFRRVLVESRSGRQMAHEQIRGLKHMDPARDVEPNGSDLEACH